MLSFNNKEKDEKLLDWVRSRVDKLEVENFSSSWRSGVLLCALVDSIVPGSCPRYDLLNEENRLGNSQLAVQLLEKLNIKSVSGAFRLSKLFRYRRTSVARFFLENLLLPRHRWLFEDKACQNL